MANSRNRCESLKHDPDYQCVRILESTLVYESEHIVSKLGFFELQQVLEMAKKDFSGNLLVLREKIMKLLKANCPTIDESLRLLYSQSERRTERSPRLIDLPPVELKLCLPNEMGLEGFERYYDETIHPTGVKPVKKPLHKSTYDLSPKYLSLYVETPKLVSCPKYEPYLIFRFSRLSVCNSKLSYIYMTINDGPVLMTTPRRLGIKEHFPTMDVIIRMRLLPVAKNKLTVQWWPGEPKSNHCLAVILMNRLTAPYMFEILKEKCPVPAIQTRARLATFFAANCNSGSLTMANMIAVSLLCPLGGSRLQVPCRGQACEHVHCFDAWMYLFMNEREPHWLCPICMAPTAFDDLIIDEYFSQVLASDQLGEYDNCINVFENGDWKVVPFSGQLEPSEQRSMKMALKEMLPSHYAPTVNTITELPEELDTVATIRPVTGQAPPSCVIPTASTSYRVNIYLQWEGGKTKFETHAQYYTPDRD